MPPFPASAPSDDHTSARTVGARCARRRHTSDPDARSLCGTDLVNDLDRKVQRGKDRIQREDEATAISGSVRSASRRPGRRSRRHAQSVVPSIAPYLRSGPRVRCRQPGSRLRSQPQDAAAAAAAAAATATAAAAQRAAADDGCSCLRPRARRRRWRLTLPRA